MSDASLAAIRDRLVAVVAQELDGLSVFAGWPGNVSAPCAVVSMGAGVQRKRLHWETQWHVTVLGPAGDNLAAAGWVEDMTARLAAAVSQAFTAQVSWERPVVHTAAGSPYYAAELAVTLDMEPGA